MWQAALGLGALSLGRVQAAAAWKPTRAAQARWAELLDYARWAPSPHNIQPWKLRVVSDTEAELYYDPARLLPYTDPTSAFTIIGLGIFIESLRVAAAPLGLGLDVRPAEALRLDYAATAPTWFARLRLRPGADPAPDRELLKERRTARRAYDGRPVAAAVQQEMATLATAYGHQLSLSSDPALIDFVLDLNCQTLFADLDDAGTRRELSTWIRTTDEQAAHLADGLWSRCMGFPGWLMHNFFFHSERFRAGWKRAVLGRAYRHSMRGTATVAWLQGPFATPADWLRAGALLQRLWLDLSRHGVYLHPFGSVVTNPAAHQQFLTRAGAGPAAPPLWLLMRLGYGPVPPRSFRLTVNDLLMPS